MPKHPPAHRREVLRRLKAGEHPAELLREARTIDDPGHAAAALFAVAADPRVPSPKAGEALGEVRRLLRRVDRPGRVAEAWQGVLADLPEWRPGQHEMAKDDLVETALRAIEKMPNGSWALDATEAMAPHVGRDGRVRILRRTLQNQGFDVAGGKAVLRAAQDSELPALRRLIDAARPEVASALHAFLAARGQTTPEAALAQAWEIEDEAKRAEALRVMVWNADDAVTLDAIAASTRGRSDEDAVRLLTVIAARADRIGIDDAAQRFARAQTHARALPEGHRLRRKLTEAMQRAGMDVQHEAPAPVPDAAPAAQAPVEEARRHVLAIVDGYQGGLGPAHVRAVARAAPLCDAFGLDLALIGFPATTAEDIVRLVEAESNIGETGGHARVLLEADRLRIIPLEHGVPSAWPARPIATTPHPQGAAVAGLDSFAEPLCLLVGLGRNGLPKRLLNIVPDHYELTGKGISLETATAMGILADRLGRVKVTS